MSTPAPTANPDGDTLTIVSSAVGTMIIVIVVLGTVTICYRQHHNNNKQRWFHFRRNVLSSPMSSFDFRSDKSTADDENHNGYQYDAFISFNEQDRSWVYTNLVPKLEPPKRSVDSNEPSIEKLNWSFYFNRSCCFSIFHFVWSFVGSEPSFHLCLHDRDFTVGQQITENIIENIAKSRKVSLSLLHFSFCIVLANRIHERHSIVTYLLFEKFQLEWSRI